MITIARRQKWSKHLSRLFDLMNTDVKIYEARDVPKKLDGILFRYGVYVSSNADAYINSNRAISIDKATARRILQQRRISIPITVYSLKEAKALLKLGKTLIGRPKNHFGGKHFYVIRTIRDLLRYNSKCDYYSVFIPKDKEYRVFVLLRYVIGVAEKERGEDMIRWNHRHGAVFKNVRFSAWDRRLVLLALETADALGLDFTAIDIMKWNNRYYVLEANKAPAMDSDYRLKVFARCLDFINEYWDAYASLPMGEPIKRLPRWRDVIFPALTLHP